MKPMWKQIWCKANLKENKLKDVKQRIDSGPRHKHHT